MTLHLTSRQLPNGTIEISWSDGSVATVRDELTLRRILRALRQKGRPFVHLRPREDEPEKNS